MTVLLTRKIYCVFLTVSVLLGLVACGSEGVTYRVGGTVSGLRGSVTMLNNDGDAATVTQDGEFIFNTTLSPGSAYNVTVGSQPAQSEGWSCSVKNGAGIVYNSGIKVDVICKDSSAPVLKGIVTAVGLTEKTLTAEFADNVGVTGYCFKVSGISPPTRPLASDVCFQSASQTTADLVTSYYVWARDAEGNVSRTSCSSAGYAASDAAFNAHSLPTVCMLTNLGEMIFELESTKAPITVTNFLKYVNDGSYTNTVFHRIISNLVVQGGGYQYLGNRLFASLVPNYSPISLESPVQTGLSNTIGTIAMARASDINSATVQFFLNVADNAMTQPSWDGLNGYAVFGKLIYGDATLDAVKAVPVTESRAGDPNPAGEVSLPTDPPVIQRILQLK